MRPRKEMKSFCFSELLRLKAKAHSLPFIMATWQKFSLAGFQLSVFPQNLQIKILTKWGRFTAPSAALQTRSSTLKAERVSLTSMGFS